MVLVHVASVVTGIIAGTLVLLRPKGTRAHRTVGWVYVAALLTTAMSSFGIYEVRPGAPSVFHVISVLIIVVIAAGLVSIRRALIWRAASDIAATSGLGPRS